MERSPFMSLPLELRNRIYELALQHETRLKITWPTRRRIDQLVPVRKDCGRFALLVTCRQIREECTQVLYSVNIFELRLSAKHYDPMFHVLNRFLNSIGDKNKQALRTIHVPLLDPTLTHLPGDSSA